MKVLTWSSLPLPIINGLRNYQVEGQIGLEETFEEYLDKMIEIMKEIKRVVKKTGQIWINMGDSYGGPPAGNKSISEANIGKDGYFARVMERNKGAKSFIPATDNERMFSGKSNNSRLKQTAKHKCLLMQPERFAIRCIDEVGLILRNKIKWAKQVLIKKENRTIGSVMPTSVKDRFNESGEELYFFVKSKKYWSDLDAVRLPHQVSIEDIKKRIEYDFYKKGGKLQGHYQTGVWSHSVDYLERKFKFNYRVRDAIRKKGQPQFRAAEKEIKEYQGKFAGRKDAEMFNSPKARTQRQKKNAAYDWSKRINSLTPFEWKSDAVSKRNKVKYDISKRQEELKRKGGLSKTQRVQGFYDTFGGETNPKGKNIPTIWQINPEPHNFSKELGVDTEHFAVFPEALVEIPIKFGCPKNGIVLDPFIGSGTTAVVAKKLGRDFIGIEISKDYCRLAQRRIDNTPCSLL